MSRRLVVASLVVAAGCSGSNAAPAPAVALRTAGGGPPDLTSVVRARVRYQTESFGSVEERFEVAPSDDGSFDLAYTVEDPESPVWTRVELEDTNGIVLVGGSPSVTSDEVDPVDVVVGVPGSCVVVPELALGVGRESAAAVVQGRYVLVAGGNEAGGASARIDRLDLGRLGRIALPDAAAPLGPAKATPIDRNRALVVPSQGAAFVQSIHSEDADAGRRFPALHEGANASRALATLGTSGAIVVGGGDALSPSDRVSFVIPTNEFVFELVLPEATLDRAAGAGTAGLWVVSHVGASASLVQIQTTTSEVKVRIAAFADGVRHDGWLFTEPTGMRMVLLGGTDENGDVRTDTRRIGGCPVACDAAVGPVWTGARHGASFEPSGYLVGGEGPSAVVERVRYPIGDEAFIEPFATLVIPRRAPAVAALPSGVLLVTGGVGASGYVPDTELCFPPD